MNLVLLYFTLLSVPVSIPLTDSQDYDLVIDLPEGLKKVQVKTTGYKVKSGSYSVGLRVLGGNTKKNFVHKKADQIFYDYLFIVTEANTKYLIPKKDIVATNAIALGEKYNKYIVI